MCGCIEIVCGCMFSGKSEELLRRLRRSEIAKQNVLRFKPSFDKRFSLTEIVSRSGVKNQSIPAHQANEIFTHILPNTFYTIGIDEAQFFDPAIVEVVQKLADMGNRVIVSCLDMDYLGKPFETVISLLGIAQKIKKLSAICVKCGEPAYYSFLTQKQESRLLLDNGSNFEPRCRKHFLEG